MNQYAFGTVWLLDVVIKVSLLLLVVWVGSLFLRKRSAAAQHRWWTLGFIGCLLLPAIAFVVPTWTLPILPAAIETSVSSQLVIIPTSGNSTRVDFTPNSELIEQIHQLEMSTRPLPVLDSGSMKTVTEQPIASSKVPAEKSGATSLAEALVILWVVGIAACWLRNIWQHILLQRLLRCSVRLDNPNWNEAFRRCSELLGLRHEVSLLQHKSAHSPVSTGFWNPAVILPHDAEGWGADRRRLVLLHELAHVKRRDVLTQNLAGLVCGFYWFNPIGWYGLFQMRKFRELACDDLVLSCGQQPSNYADVLLGIARSYQHHLYSTAVGMAHGTNVESRIMAILDGTRHRIALNRRASGMLLASAAALVCLAGTADLRSQAEPTAAITEQRNEKRADAKSEPLPRVFQHGLEVRQARVVTGQNEIRAAQRNQERNVFEWSFEGKEGKLTEWLRIDLEGTPLLTETDVTAVSRSVDIGRRRTGEEVSFSSCSMQLTTEALKRLREIGKPQADQRFVVLVKGQPTTAMAYLGYAYSSGGGQSLIIHTLSEQQFEDLSDVVYQPIMEAVALLEELAITIGDAQPTDEQLENVGRLFDTLESALWRALGGIPSALDKRIAQFENVLRVENVSPRAKGLLCELYKLWATDQLPDAKAER
jgi:beta-lactamase regulating signal transducer with metallopeptidase domain